MKVGHIHLKNKQKDFTFLERKTYSKHDNLHFHITKKEASSKADKKNEMDRAIMRKITCFEKLQCSYISYQKYNKV